MYRSITVNRVWEMKKQNYIEIKLDEYLFYMLGIKENCDLLPIKAEKVEPESIRFEYSGRYWYITGVEVLRYINSEFELDHYESITSPYTSIEIN